MPDGICRPSYQRAWYASLSTSYTICVVLYPGLSIHESLLTTLCARTIVCYAPNTTLSADFTCTTSCDQHHMHHLKLTNAYAQFPIHSSARRNLHATLLESSFQIQKVLSVILRPRWENEYPLIGSEKDLLHILLLGFSFRRCELHRILQVFLESRTVRLTRSQHTFWFNAISRQL